MSTSPKAIQPKDLITGSTRTSSLPEIFIMINEVVNDPTSSFSDIAQVVNLDTALSARLRKPGLRRWRQRGFEDRGVGWRR